jgi:phage terminase large subunit-like protein
MTWNLSCPDWADRLRKGLPPVPDLPLFRAEADRAVAIFNRLRLPDVTGTPTFAEAGGDWFQNAFVAPLMGSYDPIKKVRMIREIFGLVAKKQSKTTSSSGLMLTAMLMNKRPRADFIYVGPTQEVAQLAYDATVGMIQLDPELAPQFHIQEHKKQISYRGMEREGWKRPEDRWIIAPSRLKVKSFDPAVMTGSRGAGILLDEIHAVSQSDADRVIGQARGGMESQPEGFLIIISTQSERIPHGIFKAELKKARAIRDGDSRMANVPMLPVLYEFPDDIAKNPEKWNDDALWYMVLPNLGRSVHIESLKQAKEAAEFSGPEELARWASQFLNVEVGIGIRAGKWIAAELWEKCGDPSLTLELLIEKSDTLVMGVDQGGLDDLAAAVVVGRDAGTRAWMVWLRAWAYEIALERRKSEASRLRDFAAAGDLTILSRSGEITAQIGDLVERISATGKLPDKAAIGVDSYKIGDVKEELTGRGIEIEQIVGIPQGWQLTGSIFTCERKLSDGTLRHAAQPLMNWAMANAKIETRGNNVAITKQSAGTSKIDPVVALLNGISLLSANPSAGGSVYSATRGLIILSA